MEYIASVFWIAAIWVVYRFWHNCDCEEQG
jgi:hypothetical protein